MRYLFLVICIFLSSCGYRIALVDDSKKAFTNKSICVLPLENRTTNTRIQLALKEALIREILRRGNPLLTNYDEAQLVLKGEIKRINTEGISFLRYDRALERRVGVSVSISVFDKKSGVVLWKNDDIYREESFFVGRELMETEGLMEDAIKRLADKIAVDVVHWILD